MRFITVKGEKYIQVVEYYKEINNKKKMKVLKSFGKYSPENELEAKIFLDSYNNAIEYKKQLPKNDNYSEILDKVKKIGGGILAIYLGIELLKKIFSDDES